MHGINWMDWMHVMDLGVVGYVLSNCIVHLFRRLGLGRRAQHDAQRVQRGRELHGDERRRRAAAKVQRGQLGQLQRAQREAAVHLARAAGESAWGGRASHR